MCLGKHRHIHTTAGLPAFTPLLLQDFPLKAGALGEPGLPLDGAEEVGRSQMPFRRQFLHQDSVKIASGGGASGSCTPVLVTP